jgi:hypothetical protein
MIAIKNTVFKFLICLACVFESTILYAATAPEDSSKSPIELALNPKTTQTEKPTSSQSSTKKIMLDGYIRSYYFTRHFSNKTRPNQTSFSLGGALNLKTAPFHHWSANLSYYAADPLDLNSTNFNRLDPTLPGESINVLGQAYLQYKVPTWLLRGGDQIIKTPWLNDADSRIIPATYQALLTTVTPIPDLELTAFRQFRYKSRTSKEFSKTNLYDPHNFGGTPIIGLEHESILGTLAGGTKYAYKNLVTQAWYYKFYDFANLFYVDANYIFKNPTRINPIISLQLAKEWGDGNNILKSLGLGKTDSAVFGALIGVEIYEGQITLGYDYIPKTSGAFQNGDIVSPYTTGYVPDPLYTTSMIAGLVEKAAGHAFKLTSYYFLLDKQLKLAASFAKYYTLPTVKNTNEVDVDVTYKFNKTLLKGLSLRNRVGILNGNRAFGRFIYNRVMLQYDFG